MARGVRWHLVGPGVLGLIGLLAGCSGGGFLAEREPWRHEAEAQCLNSGAVREGAGVVRISPIHGPGMCGADFPLRVSTLGETSSLGYSDDPRPPGLIPGNGAPARWPIIRPNEAPNLPEQSPYYPRGSQPPSTYPREGEQPVSLNPPNANDRAGAATEPFDFRRPYGRPSPTPAYVPPRMRGADSPRGDFSPEPYERRPLVDAPGARETSGSIMRAPLRDPASLREAPSEGVRGGAPPIVPLGPARALPGNGALTPVAVNPPATLACPIVSELDRWIMNVVQPAAMRWLGAPVAEIKQISAYSCRGMNGNPNARISEHAFGNALDIAAFILADGRTVSVKNGWHGLPEEQGFLRDIQGAACEQFTTVLAPGSNVYHYDHIHVDLMRRHSGYRVCNPQPVSGAEVAARGSARYAATRGGGAAITGSLSHHRLPPPPKQLKSDPGYYELRERPLPLAEPGEDGEDD